MQYFAIFRRQIIVLMSKIVKNYLYNVLYNILVLIAPLITAPYLARILGAEQLGIYSYINSATSIIISISIIGLYSYGSRQIAYVRDDRERLSQEFWNLMGLRVCLGIIGSVIYFVYAAQTKYLIYFSLYYIYYLGNAMDCTWLFNGVENMKIPALKNIAAKLISVAGIFVFVHNKNDLWKYILLLAGATFIGMIFTYPQIGKYASLKRPDLKSFKKHGIGAVVLFLPSLVATIYLQMDKVMIEWLTNDTAEVAFYDQAEKIVMIPLTFITVLSTVLMPRIANEFANYNKKKITELLTKACKVSLFMAFPLMFGIAAIAENFIPWYLGNEFLDTSVALMILSPIVLSNTLIGISGTQYFIATNQVKILLFSNSLAAVLNIIVNRMLIPQWGYIGAAIATLISNYVLVMVQYYALSKQVAIREMFKRTEKYLIVSSIMFGVVYAIGEVVPHNPFSTILQIMIGMIVYFGSLLLIRDNLTSEFIVQIKKRINRNE